MSSLASPFLPMPKDTAYVAGTLYGSDNRYLIIGDQAERLLAGIDLAPLDPIGHQSAWTLAMCALVTILQFIENLPDQCAAAATRVRPDWKFALHLPAAYPGFDHRRLCEFRRQVWRQPAARLTLQHVLDRVSDILPDQPTLAVAEVVRAVCAISRLERLVEAMHLVLEAVAVSAPDWLRTIARPYWYERYNRLQLLHLLPRTSEQQIELARAINADAVYLLDALAARQAPAVLTEVQSLWLEWDQQFSQSEQQLEWHGPKCMACDEACNASVEWCITGRTWPHFAS
ncbi:MAG: transposase [Chloroflexi bacterium]|nr:transposase [Chloroflexota bacterium]